MKRSTIACLIVCVCIAACGTRATQDAGDATSEETRDIASGDGALDATQDAAEEAATDAADPDASDAMDAADAMDAGADLDAAVTGDADAGSDGASLADGLALVDAACGATITAHPILDSPHVDVDAGITWNSNPPSSGPHFGIWARWGVYTDPIPRGYLVHSLEHGAVVLSYRCANRAACPAVHDQLARFVAALPPEPGCVPEGVRRRIILTPDPLLDPSVTVAGAAWGHTYRATCVDERSLETFVLGTTGRAPEDFCADGFYPEVPADSGVAVDGGDAGGGG
ncbi:MAG: DUF3105 domain-containing protein [Myxococcales bacterium]|nr:DUF3105 domain-containing protein [Myxococcales bacterium]